RVCSSCARRVTATACWRSLRLLALIPKQIRCIRCCDDSKNKDTSPVTGIPKSLGRESFIRLPTRESSSRKPCTKSGITSTRQLLLCHPTTYLVHEEDQLCKLHSPIGIFRQPSTN